MMVNAEVSMEIFIQDLNDEVRERINKIFPDNQWHKFPLATVIAEVPEKNLYVEEEKREVE